MEALNSLFAAFATWAGEGLLGVSGLTMVAVTLVVTHLTIISVTLFLHRSQAHRALDLHAIPSHFFRFWLWLTTGMVTKEWVSIHRKHHAKCETSEDPHSPVAHGLSTVLQRGSELYRAEAKNQETLSKYGHGTPNDWIERNLYTRHSVWGVSLLLIVFLALFGAWGATMWAVTMMWIPVTAAGIINGLGHAKGYRNFEAPDASTNLMPWGLVIGGEELHNNHHTFPTSAKFSVKRFEFDLGWFYIRVLQTLKLAQPRKVPPQMLEGDIKPADQQTLETLIANRYEVMARFGREMRAACRRELKRLKAEGAKQSAQWRQIKLAKRWLPRDADRIPGEHVAQIQAARMASPALDKLVQMREELRSLWTRTNVSAEQLVKELQAWCQRAEESGVAELRALSMRLRASRMPAFAM
ncbi:DesA family fatty acid desaturase [Inhella crocodyli]|uniref:Acyl-CoA desaturase n=1 Tax=Inhella crocodyli TaxID=2499851 RepID=A0A437LRS0_9BURK|nr:fatty acid desaturase [Inhella crocodyli]RVT87913.1 acyl-CoA desaturase [Inhella crocodyli]